MHGYNPATCWLCEMVAMRDKAASQPPAAQIPTHCSLCHQHLAICQCFVNPRPADNSSQPPAARDENERFETYWRERQRITWEHGLTADERAAGVQHRPGWGEAFKRDAREAWMARAADNSPEHKEGCEYWEGFRCNCK
jgi:hypothetical protein